MFQKNIKQNMGEMQIFTHQTGPLSLALSGWGRAAPPALLGKGQASGGRHMGGRTLVKSPRRRGFCLEWKRAFRQGAVGRNGWSTSEGMRPPQGTEAPRSLYFRKYRKFTGMRVRESFIAYSQGFQIWQGYFGVKTARGLCVFGHWPSRTPDLPL